MCRNAERVARADMIVPFKRRCGVKDLNDISINNMCYCTEEEDNGVGERNLSNVVAWNFFKNISFSTC